MPYPPASNPEIPAPPAETRLARTHSTCGVGLTVQRPRPDTLVAAVTGEVDLGTAPNFEMYLLECLRTSPPRLVIDLSAVRYLGVAGLNLLLGIRRLAAKEGVALLVVTGDARAVTRPIVATGLSGELAVFATVDAALEVRPAAP